MWTCVFCVYKPDFLILSWDHIIIIIVSIANQFLEIKQITITLYPIHTYIEQHAMISPVKTDEGGDEVGIAVERKVVKGKPSAML